LIAAEIFGDLGIGFVLVSGRPGPITNRTDRALRGVIVILHAGATDPQRAGVTVESTPSQDEQHQGDDGENQHDRDKQPLGHASTSFQSLRGLTAKRRGPVAGRPEHPRS
jgi:hypothetical protein